MLVDMYKNARVNTYSIYIQSFLFTHRRPLIIHIHKRAYANKCVHTHTQIQTRTYAH